MTTGTRRQMRPTDVKRLNRTWRRGTENRLSLILESVTGPFNVGSIFRTAARRLQGCAKAPGDATRCR